MNFKIGSRNILHKVKITKSWRLRISTHFPIKGSSSILLDFWCQFLSWAGRALIEANAERNSPSENRWGSLTWTGACKGMKNLLLAKHGDNGCFMFKLRVKQQHTVIQPRWRSHPFHQTQIHWIFFSLGTSCSFEWLYQFCHYEETYGPEARLADPKRNDCDWQRKEKNLRRVSIHICVGSAFTEYPVTESSRPRDVWLRTLTAENAFSSFSYKTVCYIFFCCLYL